jgi:hypothetical protein
LDQEKLNGKTAFFGATFKIKKNLFIYLCLVGIFSKPMQLFPTFSRLYE